MDNADSLWNKISTSSYDFEHSMDKLHRKQTGSYYTSLDLTMPMLNELFSILDKERLKNIQDLKFLEPCVGTGNFVFTYLRLCKQLGLTKSQAEILINNIYVCDINTSALDIYKNNLSEFAYKNFDIELNDEYFNTHIGGGLLFDLDSTNVEYISINDVFGNLDGKFDIVATNPPYKNLKVENGQYDSTEKMEADRKRYKEIAKISQGIFPYSAKGTLNIYKLFVEEILERYIKDDGFGSLLIPASIMSDKTCASLRGRIFDTSSVQSLRLIPETSPFVDASQALCAILFEKGKQTKNLRINGSFIGSVDSDTLASVDDVLDRKMDNSILILNEKEYSTRKKMNSFPKIKDISYIHNLRGELDITFGKEFITDDPNGLPLLRGRNIGYYKLNASANNEYVNPRFLDTTAKAKYVKQSRLICQQIVNMAKKRRVSFAIAPENSVLANSCNFISIDENDNEVDLYFLLGVLNSSYIDWYFRLSSSNNHINNYEIDEFPIPVDYKDKQLISSLVKKYLETPDDSILQSIELLVGESYGIVDKSIDNQEKEAMMKNNNSSEDNSLDKCFARDLSYVIGNVSKDEALSILEGRSSCDDVIFANNPSIDSFSRKVLYSIETKYRKLYDGEILNHTTFKLSDLDLEMIKDIPQGGSWKDIPAEVVKKSKRLVRITQTGGRTTLYGRLDYNKPSYTITTYFNRPGNGTYVHPVHERVLSVREAARFQCFPDDYYFFGNKTDTLKQVGNAVPVMLAYNIGKSIFEKTGCHTSVDLFSGAGGMTYGLKRAGIDAVIANDFMESACVTLKANCPEIPVLFGDVTDDYVKQQIIDEGVKHHADIICGGPPCQGFSMAGFRAADDPRNQLFRDFVEIVSKVNPKVIVFENVPGLMSYKGGETYRQIVQLFSDLGYEAEGRMLMANEYGAPQKRKRVIILCIRKDLGLKPDDVYPEAITKSEDKQVTVRETIADLENVACSEHAAYNSDYTSPILKYLKGESDIDTYLDAIRNR